MAKQPIRILHLSDFHFDKARKWDADPVLMGLATTIGEFVKEMPPDVVAITGDIANTGRARDYAEAQRWIDGKLRPVLPTRFPKSRILMVPGNHDGDRKLVKRSARSLQADLLRERSQDAIAEVLADRAERDGLLKRHDAYLAFANQFRPSRKKLDAPWWAETITVQGKTLCFLGLCSSWMSWSDDDQGSLLLGRWQVNALRKPKATPDLTIALLHHPWSYFREFDGEEVKRTVRREADLVLRGHLHAQESEKIETPDEACIELAAGCAYQTSEFPNAFQLVEFLPDQRCLLVHFFTWHRGGWIIDRNAYRTARDGVVRLQLRLAEGAAQPAPPPGPAPAPVGADAGSGHPVAYLPIAKRDEQLGARIGQMRRLGEAELFQRFCIMLLPSLGYRNPVASHPKTGDLGCDATASTAEGDPCCVAISFDSSWTKVHGDAGRWREAGMLPEARILVFMTWQSRSSRTLKNWAAKLADEFGIELRVYHEHTLLRHATSEQRWSETCDLLGIGPGRRTAPKADPTQYLLWLQRRTAHIDIRGLEVGSGKAHQFPIHDLYIPLTTSMAPPPTRRCEKGKADPGPEAAMREGRRVELEEALAGRNLVIVGDPGGGKTTFVNRIANLLCGQALGKGQDARLARAVGEAAFPILIRVPELAEYIGKTKKDRRGPTLKGTPCWIAHYAGDLCREGALGLDKGFFMDRLASGQATVLLDGLDEAPSRQLREEVAGLVDAAAGRFETCRFVVTTRPAAYRGKSLLGEFARVEIEPLEDSAIETFLSRWCEALYHDDPDQADLHKRGLIRDLHARPEIRRLARNPVMLTALAVVHWNETRLPEQRADLYESIIKWLSQSRERREGRPSAKRCVALLANLALAMQAREGSRKVQVRQHWAARMIAPEWRRLPKDKRLAEAEGFLEEEELDSGIIVKRGDDVRFWHLTFQEFLAARALAAKDEERLKVLKGDKIYLPEWREVVLLLAGVLYHQGVDRVDAMFSAALSALPKRAALAREAQCVGLLGAAVRDLSPVDMGYQPRDGRYAASLERVTAIFDAEKARGIDIEVARQAAEALGQAGDPRFATAEAREQNWVTVPAGEFLMGAQKKDSSKPNYDPEASSSESPVHPVCLGEYRIGRYPVTVCEYQRFVDDGGYTKEDHWPSKGFGKWPAPEEWEDQLQHPNRPVVCVSWYEAAAYAAWAGCRLPTEAEWERAARGTDGRRYPWGDDEPNPALLNSWESRIHEPTPVGLYPGGASPNGVLDMAGNVWEWCSDWYGGYADAEVSDPRGPASGPARVVRGGSWGSYARLCRSAYRDGIEPERRGGRLGFRVVLAGRGLPE